MTKSDLLEELLNSPKIRVSPERLGQMAGGRMPPEEGGPAEPDTLKPAPEQDECDPPADGEAPAACQPEGGATRAEPREKCRQSEREWVLILLEEGALSQWEKQMEQSAMFAGYELGRPESPDMQNPPEGFFRLHDNENLGQYLEACLTLEQIGELAHWPQVSHIESQSFSQTNEPEVAPE